MLRHVAFGWSIQPPSTTSRPSISSGRPGAHVICSTLWFCSSHLLAGIITTFPLALRTGVPVSSSIGCDGKRASTLAFGQSSLQGM